MLKKQHKSRSDKPADPKPSGGAPDQSSNRRDEVGRSGVHPQSGPHPDDPKAPVRNQGTWGEGEKAAEGAGSGLGQGGRARSPRNQDPKAASLDELYEQNTDIKRETEFRDSTAHPLDPDAGGPTVTPENDIFHNEKE